MLQNKYKLRQNDLLATKAVCSTSVVTKTMTTLDIT